MIKLIIFDLDGVLVNTRELHYESLNQALSTYDIHISKDEHLAKYDGHPTKYKLNLLSNEKNLSPHLHDTIWKTKQNVTQTLLKDFLKPDPIIINTLKELSKSYKIYVASNSIWTTIKNSLLYTDLLPYVDYFVSCEEVKYPKPSPEIYFKCFEHANISPHEAIICEDSPIGLESAYNSHAHVLPIQDKNDVTLQNINKFIHSLPQITLPIAPTTNINIVIPMAGLGSRFSKAGYVRPKPLIDVKGKPMIQQVVENIGIKGHFIFIVQKEHYDTYYLDIILNAIAPNCSIVQLDGVTEGAACSVLSAKGFIDNNIPLIIANSDQLLEWDPYQFLYCAMNVDGCISTFNSQHPKFSYAKTDMNGYVTEVAEKVVISENATTGVYYWKQGSDFVKYAQQMITNNIRVNNEFYVAPVYNQAIHDGKKIKIMQCKAFHCLGTPEDLEEFIFF